MYVLSNPVNNTSLICMQLTTAPNILDPNTGFPP